MELQRDIVYVSSFLRSFQVREVKYTDVKSNSVKVNMLVAQSYLTLCDPMDCSPPGPSKHGIHQARILEWFAIPFSRGSA